MERESFIFYASYFEAINELDDSEQLSIYKAIASYSLTGIEPELRGALKAVFLVIKPQIDANNKRYTDGSKGGRPKKTSGYENLETKKTSGYQDIKIEKTTGYENKKPPVLNNNKNEKPNENENENENVLKPPYIPPRGCDEKTPMENPKNSSNDFIDFDFVKSEYEKGDFDFDLERFWTYWKDKGIRQKELSNKLISWDIRYRDKLKLQNAMQQLNAQARCTNTEESEEEFYI